jgi:hypothetical protein
MLSSFVLTSSGGYLNAIAHRGAREVNPSSACRAVVDLEHHAVHLVLQVVTMRLLARDVGQRLGQVGHHLVVGADRQPPGGQRSVGL